LNRDIFADDAAHPIDFLFWLLGKPVSVVAELGSLLNPLIPHDNGMAIFRYADGAFGEVSCSFAAAAGENTAEIVCQHGTIVGNYGDQVSTMVPRPPGAIHLKWYVTGDPGWTVSDLPDVAGQGERIAGLAAPLAEFLHGRRPPIATAEEGRTVLRLTLACLDAAEQGRRMVID
jgi:predicted dehydrogenase